METIQITTEQLEQLRLIYPGIAEHGDRCLVTYCLSRFIYQTQVEATRPQLPSFLGR